MIYSMDIVRATVNNESPILNPNFELSIMQTVNIFLILKF